MSLARFFQQSSKPEDVPDAELERRSARHSALVRLVNQDSSSTPYFCRPREFDIVHVNFEVTVDRSIPQGVAICILGDRRALREWDKDNACPLRRSNSRPPVYRTTIDLAVGHHAVEFKLVAAVKIDDRFEVVAYEAGENRVLDILEQLTAAAAEGNGTTPEPNNITIRLDLRDWDRPVAPCAVPQVRFETEHPVVPWAQVIAIGNRRGLGHWDKANAVPLEPLDLAPHTPTIRSSPIALVTGEFEFKYALVAKTKLREIISWERGPNRVVYLHGAEEVTLRGHLPQWEHPEDVQHWINYAHNLDD